MACVQSFVLRQGLRQEQHVHVSVGAQLLLVCDSVKNGTMVALSLSSFTMPWLKTNQRITLMFDRIVCLLLKTDCPASFKVPLLMFHVVILQMQSFVERANFWKVWLQRHCKSTATFESNTKKLF